MVWPLWIGVLLWISRKVPEKYSTNDLVFGLGFGLVVGLGFGLVVGLGVGLVVGLVVGVVLLIKKSIAAFPNGCKRFSDFMLARNVKNGA